MGEIKINYQEFDEAILKMKILRQECAEISCDISIKSTGKCAELLKAQKNNLNTIKTTFEKLLSKTEDFLTEAKTEFCNTDMVISKEVEKR